jgi:rubrerythrin
MMPQDIYTYPYNLPMALQLIREAVSGEREDEMFYNYLVTIAPEEDKSIIRGIRDDELKHFRLFKNIYYELTGQMLPPPPEGEFTKPASYCAGLKKAMLGELAAVEKYRKILFALQDRRQINMLTEIITDELRHGNLYNLLYSKNECYKEK